MAKVRQKPTRSSRSRLDEAIVEKGDIFFAYRPRTGEDKAKGLEDVQRFFMVLKPEGQNLVRLAVLGRKRLPQAKEHERIWGFVDTVAINKTSSAVGGLLEHAIIIFGKPGSR
jgi:hypothetical protein